MAQSYPDVVISRLREAYPVAGDPDRAVPMVAYMRHRFDFLGIPTPQRRALARNVLAGLPEPSEADLLSVAHACWSLSAREYQYFGTDLLVRHATRLTDRSAPALRRLITTKPWWDTVDALASRVVGSVVARYPSEVATMDSWIGDRDIWLIRSALLHQLRYRTDTDPERLFRYCRFQAEHPDFFVRKAIGWALREYARTDPEAVRRFVTQHRDRLAALSVREAVRHLSE